MLTVQYAIDNQLPFNEVLSKESRQALLEENKDNNFSYLCLMKEMFRYSHITMIDVLHGWSGIKLVEIPRNSCTSQN